MRKVSNPFARLFSKSPKLDLAPKKEKQWARLVLHADKKDLKKKREPVVVIEVSISNQLFRPCLLTNFFLS